MAKAKKGPRQAVGLQCKVCKSFGYITEYNKNNDILKKQATGKGTFPLNKWCAVCRQVQPQMAMKKLK